MRSRHPARTSATSRRRFGKLSAKEVAPWNMAGAVFLRVRLATDRKFFVKVMEG
jgi:hypothetical protein